MEFGVFVGMYHPEHRRQNGETEQDVLRAELDVVQAADRSASSTRGSPSTTSSTSTRTCRPTRRSWRTRSPSPRTSTSARGSSTSPRRCATRRASPRRWRCSTSSRQGRFEFGTGRGSSSTEVFGFGIDSMDTTRDMYDEALPEIVKMMGPDEYGPYEGDFFSMPRRKVLPKPYTPPHPPIWVAAGSPGTFEKAARMGIGVLCFSFGAPDTLAPLIEIYKTTIEKAEPGRRLREQQHHGHHRDDALEDGDRAREMFRNNQTELPHVAGRSSTSTASRRPPGSTRHRSWRRRSRWSRSTRRSRWVPSRSAPRRSDQDDAEVRGDRRRPGVVRLAVRRHALDAAIEAVETFGKFVLPEFDKDPVHSTARQREAQVGRERSGTNQR